MQQRALAAAGFAGQRHALAGRNIEIHAAQHRDLFSGRAVGLGQIANAQHFHVAAQHINDAAKDHALSLKCPIAFPPTQRLALHQARQQARAEKSNFGIRP